MKTSTFNDNNNYRRFHFELGELNPNIPCKFEFCWYFFQCWFFDILYGGQRKPKWPAYPSKQLSTVNLTELKWFRTLNFRKLEFFAFSHIFMTQEALLGYKKSISVSEFEFFPKYACGKVIYKKNVMILLYVFTLRTNPHPTRKNGFIRVRQMSH